MRSFSNIMPNFADKLHLLVDSIVVKGWQRERKKCGICLLIRLFLANFAPYLNF